MSSQVSPRSCRSLSVVLLALALLVPLATPAAPKPAKGSKTALKSGQASGTITVDGQAAELAYAYALVQPGKFKKEELDTILLLTAEPIDAEALQAAPELRTSLTKGAALLFVISGNDWYTGEVVRHPALGAADLQATGASRSDFKPGKRSKQSLSGTIATSAPREWAGHTYESKVRFKAKLRQAKAEPPLPDGLTGTALPADGGEPGRDYRASLAAIRSCDVAAIKAYLVEASELSDEEWKEGCELAAAMLPREIVLDLGFVRGDLAALYVHGDEEDGTRRWGTVRMAQQGGRWRGSETWEANPWSAALPVAPGPDGLLKLRRGLTLRLPAPAKTLRASGDDDVVAFQLGDAALACKLAPEPHPLARTLANLLEPAQRAAPGIELKRLDVAVLSDRPFLLAELTAAEGQAAGRTLASFDFGDCVVAGPSGSDPRPALTQLAGALAGGREPADGASRLHTVQQVRGTATRLSVIDSRVLQGADGRRRYVSRQATLDLKADGARATDTVSVEEVDEAAQLRSGRYRRTSNGLVDLELELTPGPAGAFTVRGRSSAGPINFTLQAPSGLGSGLTRSQRYALSAGGGPDRLSYEVYLPFGEPSKPVTVQFERVKARPRTLVQRLQKSEAELDLDDDGLTLRGRKLGTAEVAMETIYKLVTP
jgi:hypothetical protein